MEAKIEDITSINELKALIDLDIEVFVTESEKAINQGNKSAAARSRKATSRLTKLFKQYRKLSVEATKA